MQVKGQSLALDMTMKQMAVDEWFPVTEDILLLKINADNSFVARLHGA